MQVKEMDTASLVAELVRMDAERARMVKEINKYKAEVMARGLSVMEDTNTRYVKFRSVSGSCAVTDAMKLSVINDIRLRNLLPDGIYDKFTQKTEKIDYKYDSKFEAALKAIFNEDYTFEMTLAEFLDEMSIKPDEKQKKLLQKKLTGNYEKDSDIFRSVFEMKDAGQFDVELYYIHKIKNAELILRFIPAEGMDILMKEIRECMIVESSTKLEIEMIEMEEG